MKCKLILALSLAIGSSALGQMPGKQITYVQAEKATLGRDQVIRRSIGRTEAVRNVTVRAAVEGRIINVHFQEGSMINAGDLLLEIDPLRYEAAVKQAEAQIAQLNAQLTYASSRYKRFENLAAEQAASREDTETAKAAVEELKARIAGAEAELVRARKDLTDCRVKAEISGRVGRLPKGEGNYITRGEAITNITQTNPIYVRFPLSQNDVNGIFHGTKEIGNVADVQLTIANGRSYPGKGRITIVDNHVRVFPKSCRRSLHPEYRQSPEKQDRYFLHRERRFSYVRHLQRQFPPHSNRALRKR